MRCAPVAQLDRVFGYEPKGRGFESLLAYQITTQVSCVVIFFCVRDTDSIFTGPHGLVRGKTRRFCAAPEVRRMPKGGFADRRLFDSWGPHQNEVFMGNASAPRRKCGVPICPDMRRANLSNLRGPHGQVRGEYAIRYIFAATCARQKHDDPRAASQCGRETRPAGRSLFVEGVPASEVSAKSQILWSRASADA